jgi:multicomponent Na+:H+ antiporter subunit D
LTVSLLTALSMARLWDGAFWKPVATAGSVAPLRGVIVAPVGALVGLTLGLTVMAGPAFDLSKRAAAQLLNADEYVRAVLGS